MIMSYHPAQTLNTGSMALSGNNEDNEDEDEEDKDDNEDEDEDNEDVKNEDEDNEDEVEVSKPLAET